MNGYDCNILLLLGEFATLQRHHGAIVIVDEVVLVGWLARAFTPAEVVFDFLECLTLRFWQIEVEKDRA